MKKTLILIPALLCSFILFAQNYKITWGEEIKLKKGTADLDIVAADNSGLYFTEKRLRVKSFVVTSSVAEDIKLYKFDKNFSEVWDKGYKKELKGLDFHTFQTLGEDLYMFATDYVKKEKLFKVYGAKVDKNSGDLIDDFKELGSYQLESKKDDYEMKMTPLHNDGSFLMVSNISGKDRVALAVTVLDKNFKEKQSSIINLSFVPGRFSLQDVKLTNTNKIVLLGKEYDEVPYKKKKTRMIFKQYVLSIYNPRGDKEKDIAIDAGDRYIINGRLVEQPTGDLMLAGFYSNSAKKEGLSGFYINKIDIPNGTLALSSYKEINTGMFGKAYVDEGDADDETRANKKDKEAAKKAKKTSEEDDDDEEELPNDFIIRSIDINPSDNSIIFTSEVSQYSFYSYTTSTYNSATKSWNYSTTYVHRFTNKDILVISADKNGNIKWLNAIPKSQLEEIRTSRSYGMGFYSYTDYSGYFANGGAMPYYSSFTSLLYNNNLVLLMNDHTSNNTNPEYGDKVKTVYNFRKKSNAYGISIDLATGKMTRKFIASNNEDAVLMPRHAYIVNNELFMPSWRQHMLAKTELKFAKIAVK